MSLQTNKKRMLYFSAISLTDIVLLLLIFFFAIFFVYRAAWHQSQFAQSGHRRAG